MIFEPVCVNNFSAALVCIDKECTQANPFICYNNKKQIKCCDLHSKCYKMNWMAYLQKLEFKRNPEDPAFKTLCVQIQEIILESLEKLQKQYEFFNIWKYTFGMPSKALPLFQSIRQNNQFKWTGKQMQTLLKTKSPTIKMDLYRIKKEIEIITERTDENLKSIRKMYFIEQRQPLHIMSQSLSVSFNKSTDPFFKDTIELFPIDLRAKTEKKTEKTLKIKQYNLNSLNERLINLTEHPQKLQLKFMNYSNNNLKSFAQALKNSCLNDLKQLTLYWSGKLKDDNWFKWICEAIITLPKLQCFRIVVDNLQSDENFKCLGEAFECVVQPGWWKKQKWQH